jgi:hypothetical protein
MSQACFLGQCQLLCELPLHSVGELELELIQTQMTQKPILRAEVHSVGSWPSLCYSFSLRNNDGPDDLMPSGFNV